MSLSEQLKFEIEMADNHLRSALAFAAGSERTNILVQLSELIQKLDMLERHDTLMDGLDEVIKDCEQKRDKDTDDLDNWRGTP